MSTKDIPSIRRFGANLILLGFVVIVCVTAQCVRHVRSARIWSSLASEAIHGEEYCFGPGCCFKLHTLPLGPFGYFVFSDEMYVWQNNGVRLKFACSASARQWVSFRRLLRRIESGELGERYRTFDELHKRQYFLKKHSGWKSPVWLLALDFVFSLFVVSLVATSSRFVAIGRNRWRCSDFWVYCLVGIGVCVVLYLLYLCASYGQIG